MAKQKSLKINTILNIIKTCSTIVFPLITFPYVLRVLLPENVGKVNFAQSHVNYFLLISGLGLSTYAVRECAIAKRDQKELNKVSSELFSINVITTIISYILLFLSLFFLEKVRKYELLILIESITIISTTIGADWLNSSMEDYNYITIRTILFQLISLVLTFIFVKQPSDYYVFALISVLSSSGANIVNAVYRRRYCDVRFTLDINWKKHMFPIMFLFAMQLSITIFNNADITMLGLMKGDYQVGLYSTALKVDRVIAQVVQSLGLVIIPRLSILFDNEDYENANRLLRKVLGFNLTLGLPCVVGTIMMANEIILLVGGIEYIEAVPVIRIIILSFMFSLVGGSFLGNAILIPTKQEKYYMFVCCVTAVVNVALNALLIPKYAAVGAAIATALNGFLIMVLLCFKVDHRIDIPNVKPFIVAPLLGCALIAIICVACRNIANLYLRTATSILVSAASYVLIQMVFKNDIVTETLESLKKRILNR